MISYTSLRFFINAALEVVAVLFLGILLTSCILRRNKSNTRLSFCLFTINLIFLLLCNITTWVLDGMAVSPSYHPRLYKLDLVLTVFDFFFYCLAGVLFYNYLCTFISNMKKTEKTKRKLMMVHGLVIYCIVMTGLFATSMFTGWLYYFPENGYTYYTSAYWGFLVFSFPALWLSFATIFKNRKLLGNVRTFLLLSYLILPMGMAVIDQTFSLSISYVLLPLVASLIYVGVDVEQDREMTAQEAEIVKQKAENIEMGVKLMTSQIQPHFLYNTLGTIYHLCGKDASLARETIKTFTKYLRTNMESLEKNTPVPFAQELEHTKNYLSIEMLRFSDVLNVEYDIGCTDFYIPALSLQPLAENAVKHGIRSREEGGTVTISVKRENGKIYVSVHDDGMGYDTERLPDDGRMHVGIANVRKRLDYMCGGKLVIESRIGIGTTATIILEDSKE